MNLSCTTSPSGLLGSAGKGAVKDNYRPLPRESVSLKTDMQTGTSTDTDWNYNRRVPAKSIMVFKTLGDETVEKVVRATVDVNVIMHKSQTSLN